MRIKYCILTLMGKIILPSHPVGSPTVKEDNRVARIGALRRYIALLREEEGRLNQVKVSRRASIEDRDAAETGLRAFAQKISHADKELRALETAAAHTL
jgi:hypothetical protein